MNRKNRKLTNNDLKNVGCVLVQIKEEVQTTYSIDVYIICKDCETKHDKGQL